MENTEAISKLNTKVDNLEKVTMENTEAISRLNIKVDSLEQKTEENTNAIMELKTQVNGLDAKVSSLEKATKENTQSINNLVKARKKDRLELMDVLQTMDKSISKRFDEMEENINEKFNKIYLANLNNDVQHIEFKQILEILGANDAKAAKRIEKLEEWKNSIDGSLFAV